MASKEWLASWQQRAIEVMQATGANDSPCPVCQGVKHYALPMVTAPWSDPPGKGFSPEGFFLLPLVCMKCTHVRFFNMGGLALIAEKLDREKENAPRPEDS